jgi:protein-L-isoaspartate O-methyltransferase
MVFETLITAVVVLLFVLFFLAAVLPMVFFGAIFLPSRKETVERMVKLAAVFPGERAADLGSGDGRLVIALAKLGMEAHGFEINPFLVALSRWNIRKAGLGNRAFVHWQSFWQEDFSKYDLVTVFGTTKIMENLEKKLRTELKPKARVVSNVFHFPTWPMSERSGTAYLYERKNI